MICLLTLAVERLRCSAAATKLPDSTTCRNTFILVNVSMAFSDSIGSSGSQMRRMAHDEPREEGRQAHDKQQRGGQRCSTQSQGNEAREYHQICPLARHRPRAQPARERAATRACRAHPRVTPSEEVTRARCGRMCLKLNACISASRALHKSSATTSS